MAKTRENVKGRKTTHSFIGLPHYMLNSDAFAKLSPSSVKLIIDIAAQYRGTNNGDLTTAWTIFKNRGWRSKGTLYKAIKEAELAGFILRTRQGGRNKCNLFAITWKSIDECGGKLDVSSTNVAPNNWKTDPVVQLSGQPSTNIVPMRKKESSC